MQSSIYRGWLRHRRFAPRAHAFRYRLFMVYLDLAELEQAVPRTGLWPLVVRFERRDHLGKEKESLDTAVRDLVQEQTGTRPSGPIRLLTHLRYFGYCFNPVSFYYCYDAAGERVETIVAEVNNTPWGEQHCYVLDKSLRHRTGKAMHVSPFMPMDVEYEWRFTAPGTHLAVHMGLEREARKVFDATLRLERRPMSKAALAGALARFPFMTLQVIFAIHWQALRLWLKRVPVHTHPAKARYEHEHQHQRP
jgi:uncharacterized protein